MESLKLPLLTPRMTRSKRPGSWVYIASRRPSQFGVTPALVPARLIAVHAVVGGEGDVVRGQGMDGHVPSSLSHSCRQVRLVGGLHVRPRSDSL